MQKYSSQLMDLVWEYGPTLILALLTLFIGLWIIRMITRGFGKIMDKQNLDDSLKPFFKSMLSVLLKALLVISVMGMIGIEMTSFIAIFSGNFHSRHTGSEMVQYPFL